MCAISCNVTAPAVADLLEDNAAARAAVLGRIRAALGKQGDRSAALQEAERYLGAAAAGPRPRLPDDLVGRFMQRAIDMASTVERIGRLDQLPEVVARYLATLADATLGDTPRAAVCWSEFAGLDWEGVGLAVAARPTQGADALCITGSYCAIAETGTLVLLTGAETPTASALLPDTHVAVVAADRIVAGMEDVFTLMRREHRIMPRAINMISGPSRTGDIEQTIVLGAHGPYRVHIVVVDRID